MLEHNNPEIDVDALMARVQHEVLRRQFGEPADAAGGVGTIDTAPFEGLIATAAQRGGPRSRWPARFNVFPFNLPPLQRLALRVIGWLFRDQQAYNTALIQALREAVAMNVRLHASMRELEARVRRLEHRE
jgi:O-antigen chain-terminating methyltransferase